MHISKKNQCYLRTVYVFTYLQRSDMFRRCRNWRCTSTRLAVDTAERTQQATATVRFQTLTDEAAVGRGEVGRQPRRPVATTGARCPAGRTPSTNRSSVPPPSPPRARPARVGRATVRTRRTAHRSLTFDMKWTPSGAGDRNCLRTTTPKFTFALV